MSGGDAKDVFIFHAVVNNHDFSSLQISLSTSSIAHPLATCRAFSQIRKRAHEFLPYSIITATFTWIKQQISLDAIDTPTPFDYDVVVNCFCIVKIILPKSNKIKWILEFCLKITNKTSMFCPNSYILCEFVLADKNMNMMEVIFTT